VTAHLLARIQGDLRDQFAAELGAAEVSPALLLAVQRTPRAGLSRCVTAHGLAAESSAAQPANTSASSV
jgi:hypothetical protein